MMQSYEFMLCRDGEELCSLSVEAKDADDAKRILIYRHGPAFEYKLIPKQSAYEPVSIIQDAIRCLERNDVEQALTVLRSVGHGNGR